MSATTQQAAPLRGKRIVVAKPGLDGHDIGAKVIALALRDAGAEVIYTGLRKSAQHIARIAVDEGVDAVGLSILSGSHIELVRQVVEELRKLEAGDIKVFVGGTIPADDVEPLKGMETLSIIVVTMPILVPILSALGWDLIWFGIILTINMEMALIHPPVGLNLFVVHAVAPDVRVVRIMLGALPYVFIMAAVLALVAIFPSIATALIATGSAK